MPETKITIITHVRRPLWRAIFAVALQVGVIGLGVLADSPAMQWSAFVILLITAVALALADAKRDQMLTIPQARARLDEIEAKEN